MELCGNWEEFNTEETASSKTEAGNRKARVLKRARDRAGDEVTF